MLLHAIVFIMYLVVRDRSKAFNVTFTIQLLQVIKNHYVFLKVYSFLRLLERLDPFLAA